MDPSVIQSRPQATRLGASNPFDSDDYAGQTVPAYYSALSSTNNLRVHAVEATRSRPAVASAVNTLPPGGSLDNTQELVVVTERTLPVAPRASVYGSGASSLRSSHDSLSLPGLHSHTKTGDELDEFSRLEAQLHNISVARKAHKRQSVPSHAENSLDFEVEHGLAREGSGRPWAATGVPLPQRPRQEERHIEASTSRAAAQASSQATAQSPLPSDFTETERSLAALVQSKVAALNEQIERYKAEVDKARTSGQQSETALKRVEEEAARLAKDRIDFDSWREGESARLDAWQKDTQARIERERRVAVRQAKAHVAVATALPDRQERAEVDALRTQVAKLKAELAAADTRYKVTLERNKSAVARLDRTIEELQEKVSGYEQERIAVVFGGRSSLSVPVPVPGQSMTTAGSVTSSGSVRDSVGGGGKGKRSGGVAPPLPPVVRTAPRAAFRAVDMPAGSAVLSSASPPIVGPGSSYLEDIIAHSATGPNTVAEGGSGSRVGPLGHQRASSGVADPDTSSVGSRAMDSSVASYNPVSYVPGPALGLGDGESVHAPAAPPRLFRGTAHDPPKKKGAHPLLSAPDNQDKQLVAAAEAVLASQTVSLTAGQAGQASAARMHLLTAPVSMARPSLGSLVDVLNNTSAAATSTKAAETVAVQQTRRPRLEALSEAFRAHLSRRCSPSDLSRGVLADIDAGVNIVLLSERALDAGRDKMEFKYSDGTRLVRFRNGTEKEARSDGSAIVRFSNGDVKRTIPVSLGPSIRSAEAYFYASAGTSQSTYGEGGIPACDVFDFPSGQVELHWATGDKEILFPDGTVRLLHVDAGTAFSVFPDGTSLSEVVHSRHLEPAGH